MTPDKLCTILVRLPADLRAILAEVARQEGVSQATVIRRALRAYASERRCAA